MRALILQLVTKIWPVPRLTMGHRVTNLTTFPRTEGGPGMWDVPFQNPDEPAILLHGELVAEARAVTSALLRRQPFLVTSVHLWTLAAPQAFKFEPKCAHLLSLYFFLIREN